MATKTPVHRKIRTKGEQIKTAKALIKLFHSRGNLYPETTHGEARACAILCVNEIILSWDSWDEWEADKWRGVKDEIEKL